MTPNLLDELEKIVALSEKATPGMVELHTSCSWRRIVAERGRPFLVPIIDPDRHQNMDTVESAEFVVALVNWFRTNAPALADMAKRMEAAERDAAGERSESWEVWQDGMCVAGSDSLADAQHYMAMYGQDGPVKMVHVVTYRSDVIETVPAEQLAIDAAQEGAG